MDDREVYKICIELLQEKIRETSEFAQRYYADPKKWPNLKSKHDRYQAYMKAIAILEGKISQRKMDI